MGIIIGFNKIIYTFNFSVSKIPWEFCYQTNPFSNLLVSEFLKMAQASEQ